MRISSLKICNFKAIDFLELNDLPDAIVIAGPNGCGKSSIFDGIRLLKTAYGQYVQNEWQSWFGEFQIDIQQLGREAHRVLFNPQKGLLLEASLSLSENEKAFLRRDGVALAEQIAWRNTASRTTPFGTEYLSINPAQAYKNRTTVRDEAERMAKEIVDEINTGDVVARLEMDPKGRIEISKSRTLEAVFSVFQPQNIGVIDYHSPSRSYGREQIGSVNLTVTENQQRQSQHALYNTQNKYTNIKSEMASAYVKELISEKAGREPIKGDSLVDTLQELFGIFFPGKVFEGPSPKQDGRLLFQVRIQNGNAHDIDDLSSGEKEVLLGYLRLRNSAPQNSVILLDEPELHLNPRLIRGLPKFYHKHLGIALNNQLWMITHSDALLREAVEEPGMAVFHMTAAHSSSGDNQVQIVKATGDLDRAVIDLIGDMSTYSPTSKVVILEGGGDSEVDANIISQLFPAFVEQVNLLSGGGKLRVRELHNLLDQAAERSNMKTRFFSIVDRDSENDSPIEPQYMWDVYHIENYLLHSEYISKVIENLSLGSPNPSINEIEAMLYKIAESTISDLVKSELEKVLSEALFNRDKVGMNAKADDLSQESRRKAELMLEKFQKRLDTELSLQSLQNKEHEIRKSLQAALADGTWKTAFKGRDILKRLSAELGFGIPYERLRNLIVSRMREDSYQPEGMKMVLEKIQNA